MICHDVHTNRPPRPAHSALNHDVNIKCNITPRQHYVVMSSDHHFG